VRSAESGLATGFDLGAVLARSAEVFIRVVPQDPTLADRAVVDPLDGERKSLAVVVELARAVRPGLCFLDRDLC